VPSCTPASDQLDRIALGARKVEQLRLAGCRHAPQKDQPEATIAAIAAFVSRLGPEGA
jgi:hypothetical protein